MKKINIVSTMSVIIGVIILLISFKFDLKDMVGYLTCCIGVSMVIIGVLINKKLRRFIMECILNFL